MGKVTVATKKDSECKLLATKECSCDRERENIRTVSQKNVNIFTRQFIMCFAFNGLFIH